MQEVKFVSDNVVAIIVCVHLQPGDKRVCINNNNYFYEFGLELRIYFYKNLISLQITLLRKFSALKFGAIQ